MAKITLLLCDVKPCNLPAEREFEVNGEKIYVCGENCYVKFWSREYRNWKTARYKSQTTFHYLTEVPRRNEEEKSEKVPGHGALRTDLRVVKP